MLLRSRPAWMAVLLAVSPVSASAADLTLFVGGVAPGSLSTTLLASPSKTYVDLKNSPIYGVRLRTGFIPHVGLEHTVAFSSGYLVPRSLSAIADADGFVAHSNLILDLPLKQAVPYLTVGIGLIHQYGMTNPPVGTRLAVNYGGGLKVPRLFGPLGLRFDARGYSTSAIGPLSSHLKVFEISAGVFLRL